MKNTLILFTDDHSYYFDRIHRPELTVRGLFYDHAELKDPFLKLLRKMGSGWTRLYYQDWYKNLNDYQKIIVMDTLFIFDVKLMENIARKAPGARRYFYSWNMVNDSSRERFAASQRAARDAGFQYYSYDRGDCEKYGLRFNTIMYDKTLTLETADPRYDTMFLGFLKDRRDDLLSLHDMLVSAGLKPHFVIVDYGQTHENLPFTFTNQYVPYYDYLKMVGNSRAILDIAQQGQDGFSMRVMEAIFFNKKLITTNAAIRQADFYDENNIIVIEFGATTAEAFRAFFDRPFKPYDESVREYYSIEAWADRFDEADPLEGRG